MSTWAILRNVNKHHWLSHPGTKQIYTGIFAFNYQDMSQMAGDKYLTTIKHMPLLQTPPLVIMNSFII